MAVKPEILKNLQKEIPYKFKPQAVKNGKAVMVAYIDARDAQDLLDDVLGPENWQVQYFMLGEQLYANIGINVEIGDSLSEWVWKADGGTESNQEQEKGLISDSFKRACVLWGVGRFLYRLDTIVLKTAKYKEKEYPATDSGEILWGNDEITEYILSKKQKKSETKIEPAKEQRYEKPTEPPKYSVSPWLPATIERVKKVEKDGKKGKECLVAFLDKYNKAKGTTYKLISEFKTDAELIALIDFIENQPPTNI